VRQPIYFNNLLFVLRSDKTPYAKQNGGQFHFLFAKHGFSLPDDQVTVFFYWLYQAPVLCLLTSLIFIKEAHSYDLT